MEEGPDRGQISSIVRIEGVGVWSSWNPPQAGQSKATALRHPGGFCPAFSTSLELNRNT
jgi:hypothetical protein